MKLGGGQLSPQQGASEGIFFPFWRVKSFLTYCGHGECSLSTVSARIFSTESKDFWEAPESKDPHFRGIDPMKRKEDQLSKDQISRALWKDKNISPGNATGVCGVWVRSHRPLPDRKSHQTLGWAVLATPSINTSLRIQAKCFLFSV